jgi:hypothetical protein
MIPINVHRGGTVVLDQSQPLHLLVIELLVAGILRNTHSLNCWLITSGYVVSVSSNPAVLPIRQCPTASQSVAEIFVKDSWFRCSLQWLTPNLTNKIKIFEFVIVVGLRLVNIITHSHQVSCLFGQSRTCADVLADWPAHD